MTHASALPAHLWEQWVSYLSATFGVRLDAETQSHFAIYLDELAEWNANINLISIRSDEEILWRHFADSLAGVTVIDAAAATAPLHIVDLGTGAGFPGLPIKIARPTVQLTLVESITKKCAFLEHIIQRLGLTGVRICNERAELLGQDSAHRGRYDIALSRAVSKFSPNLEIALPLLKTGGTAVLYKTEKFANDPAEMESAARPLQLLGGTAAGTFCYHLPSEEAGYCLLRFAKTSATPLQYPRRPGVPEKKPL